jgi:hypothetical protein
MSSGRLSRFSGDAVSGLREPFGASHRAARKPLVSAGSCERPEPVAAIQHHDGTVGGIAGGIVVEDVQDRAPVAGVRPT